MFGIVLVSHSAELAEALARLVRGLTPGEVAVVPAGGTDDPETLGTDAARILAALQEADRGEGAVVLMDMGSAVLSAELAREMLPEPQRARIVLHPGPLVEAAVALALQAHLGRPLAEALAEAETALAAKRDQLGAPAAEEPAPADLPPTPPDARLRFRLHDPHGLHARPAAQLLAALDGFDARLALRNASTGAGPAPTTSFTAVARLGVRADHTAELLAWGPDAEAACRALEAWLADGRGTPVADEEEPDAPAAREETLHPFPIVEGLAVGPAFPLPEETPPIPDTPETDPQAETARLEEALAEADRRLTARRERAAPAEAELLDAYRLVLRDEALRHEARSRIARGASAAAAWDAAARAAAEAQAALEDPYQRARADDVRAAAAVVLRALLGVPERDRIALPEPGLLLAEDLTPLDVQALDETTVRGVALARGGPTSHAAILLRSRGLPSAGGLGATVLALPPGTLAALDAAVPTLEAPLGPERAAVLRTRLAEETARAEAERAAAHEPARTRCGTVVPVYANAGSAADVARARALGAEGIGLFRTEFLFLARTAAPTEAEQAAALAKAFAEGLPLTVRTLDAGGDKPLPYLALAPEANPFLGVRALRLSLREPDLFATQLRGILRAAAGHDLRLMLPFVTEPAEVDAARDLLEEARAALAAEGVAPPAHFALGAMVEIPSAALLADRLASRLDFLSIGTNDLAQYALAADRGHPALGRFQDALHPAVLALVAETVARAGPTPVSVCGEAAGDPVAVPVLLGLGVRALSAAPARVPRVKARIRTLDLAACRALAQEALRRDDAAAVRHLVAEALPA